MAISQSAQQHDLSYPRFSQDDDNTDYHYSIEPGWSNLMKAMSSDLVWR